MTTPLTPEELEAMQNRAELTYAYPEDVNRFQVADDVLACLQEIGRLKAEIADRRAKVRQEQP